MTYASTSKSIQENIDAATSLALNEINRAARNIMRDHPRCKLFCMGMGTATFHDAKNEPIGDWGPLPYPQYLKDFDAFTDEWDRVLHMTGCPMKILGATGRNQYDW